MSLHHQPPSNNLLYDWNHLFSTLSTLIPIHESIQTSLENYVAQLLRWNQTYHLIGPAAVPNLLTRHILDSASLLPFLPPSGTIADMGSGAGLPGIILAILSPPNRLFHLFEANQKKARFLQFIASELDMTHQVFVHKKRIEEAKDLFHTFDVCTSRALADLEIIAKLSRMLLLANGYCLAMKGKMVHDEVKQFAHGKQAIHFDPPVVHPSPFGGEGEIVQLKYVPRGTKVGK
ncbi:MAG: 16S rRNA (guanine(527)-N(7))-methyltransferase RsmG [Magnetococcales bacterium]|nr:16S rRNA (guanine(527)-N(7))-methyltransferase RsmG [Magnetococcales bacterium]